MSQVPAQNAKEKPATTRNKTVLSSAIVLYFVICFEILIMISPFAGFFYSAFNPFLLGLASNDATRWLSAFFFVHLMVPPDFFLKFIRVAGSVLFTLGITVFFICALQVYASKFFKTGPALKGLYSRIRHPQYLFLGVSGIGLAILWPRFLVVALWIAMMLVYYLLARDEERRMRKQFPETYPRYMETSGMFLPKGLEQAIGFSTVAGRLAVFLAVSAMALGGAFLLRDYTVNHLPLWKSSNIVALPIVPDDRRMLDHRMSDILQLDAVKSRLKPDQSYLVYMVPPGYIMQGLIGDTGGDWQLYKQHHSISMITDWIIHPFGHLEGGHHGHMGAPPADGGMTSGFVRRLIFVKVNEPLSKAGDAFAINAVRTPDFMIDIDVHELSVREVKTLPRETAWGRVPTPSF